MDRLTTTKRKMQVMMVAGVTVAILAAAVFALPAAIAQGTNSTQSNGNTTSAVPDIKGSVNLQNATNAYVRDNAKVPFATALSTVQNQASSDEKVTAGQLSQVQGYLVYTFKVTNYDAGTYKVVVVDAGNGSILYTSGSMTLHNGGLGCGWGWGNHHRHHFGGMNWSNKGSSSLHNNDSSSLSTQATSA